MIKSRYIIFNEGGSYYEYIADNIFDALDQYVLTLGIYNMNISLDMWNKVKNALNKTEERIDLINQLVKMTDRDNMIERIIANYTYIYGDVITPVEGEIE